MHLNCFRLPLRILSWEAWAEPFLSNNQEFLSPPVTPMPPILRRRADESDRLALEVAFRLAPIGTNIPSVFASRHGQINRSTSMLKAQVSHETTSPMDFSLSVHNAAAGLFSISKNDRSSNSALSSKHESFTGALLEAQGLVEEGHNRVLVVASDRMPPQIFNGRWDEEPAGYGFGLILSADEGEAIELSLCESDSIEDSFLPQAMVFLKMLTDGKDKTSWQRGTRHWSWSRL